ncbi:MAG: lipopolysaccharide biosynthesis protein, partial [Phocaeicola sp.]|nr:lipopolysaccharide biosynthesis protein [Phocaeicola sp.]
MSELSSNNKRIVKNTLLLYIRMFLLIIVQLYTVPIILRALGVEDYGIYNVVGGVVTMFSFVGGSLASGSQLFFAYEIGKRDDID